MRKKKPEMKKKAGVDGLKAMLKGKGKQGPKDKRDEKMGEEKMEARKMGDKMAESRGMKAHDDKKPGDKKATFLANMAKGKKAHKGGKKMSETMKARMDQGMKHKYG